MGEIDMPTGAFDVESFYSALDSQRLAQGLTWKEVSEQSGVSQPTLSRLSQGKRPDVDRLALLLAWSGLDAAKFLPSASSAEPLAQISANLRADRNLTPANAAALEEIIRVAYQQFRKK